VETMEATALYLQYCGQGPEQPAVV